MPENSNPRMPPILKKKMARPYTACVSQAWAIRTDNTEFVMKAVPEHVTILNLKIDEKDLDPEDLEYLGDEEDEGDEPCT
jgi:hypothetical protein